jgi:hypothetical protein
MCSILCWILFIWEALGWKFCIFGLIHALSTRGEKFDLEMACWMLLEGFQVVSSHCWALLHTGMTGRGHRSDRSECWSYAQLSTSPTSGGDRSDWSELSWCSCSVFFKWLACIRPGGVALVQGELACVQGELFLVFEFCLVLFPLCLSFVLSRMCRAVALA